MAYYGDPATDLLLEASKKREKEMARLRQANPIDYVHHVVTPNGIQKISNGEILYAISSSTQPTPWTLDCPFEIFHPKARVTVFGIPITVDACYKFILGDHPDVAIDDPISVPDCEHKGFVVRDIQGEDRFLCKECGERFPQHPHAPKPNITFELRREYTEKILEDFQKGRITFAHAYESLNLDPEEFKGMLEISQQYTELYEDMYTLGSPISTKVYIGSKLKRTSDPEEIDNIFTTPGISDVDLQKIWKTAFPDVTHISAYDDLDTQAKVIRLSFVDGTIQRVDIPFQDIKST